jgi:hypothetical protein
MHYASENEGKRLVLLLNLPLTLSMFGESNDPQDCNGCDPLNKERKKERKNTQQGNERRKKKDQRPNKRSHQKVQNAQWGVLRGQNLKPST